MRGLLIDTASPESPATDSGTPPIATPFDPTMAWRLHDQVALRPERFGALAYHFGTRRLSFIKDHGLLAVVRSLGDHPSARAACDDAGIPADRRPAVERALATLASSRMITAVPATPVSSPSELS